MALYKYYPIPSDRMGSLWTLLPIKDAYILEFGTSGTTRFELNSFARMQGEQNSKIFATHLDETDIALGEMTRLDKAIDEIIKRDNPPVIFVMPSTLSATMGSDIAMNCRKYQKKYSDTQIIPIKNDGFQGNWTMGVRDTLDTLVKTIPVDINKTENLTFNIIGSCADDFNYLSDVYEIKRILKGCFNADPTCIMTSDTSISDIKSMGSSHINIALRNEGINACKTLENRFGTPYVFGKPYGLKGTLQWIEKISEALKVKCNDDFIKSEVKELEPAIKVALNYTSQFKKPSVAIGAHFDVVSGIMDFLKDEAGFNISHAWCTSPDMKTDNIPFYKENQWEEIIKNGDYQILMGNAATLSISKNKCKKIQIDIPTYEFHFLKYPYAPYVGFRGALNLLNKCLNP
ncbi:nitrogenase component 1 [Clostridium amazonitimonense]|uniref:nitrogenase component 1 n=1 Tax=Clostridium amazonitimonense TaxID=1499689 RepID=UPI00050982D7|nr:nitrogenase component 1 [Clostridium amazonitimonense]